MKANIIPLAEQLGITDIHRYASGEQLIGAIQFAIMKLKNHETCKCPQCGLQIPNESTDTLMPNGRINKEIK